MNGYLYDYEPTSHSFAFSLIITSNHKCVMYFQKVCVCVFFPAKTEINIVLNSHLTCKYGLTSETGILGVDVILILDVN